MATSMGSDLTPSGRVLSPLDGRQGTFRGSGRPQSGRFWTQKWSKNGQIWTNLGVRTSRFHGFGMTFLMHIMDFDMPTCPNPGI